jgi:hypothetical protein
MESNGFTSKLDQGRQRFLVYALEHAFQVGRRTPNDFIRHFPPRTIMEALARRPDLRAELLVPTTGLKQRIAIKKSWESAGDDLQTALDERETQPSAIVEAFSPDDRVLYLSDKKLWAFLIEGDFWKVTAKDDKAMVGVAQQHMAYLLERALLDGLIVPRDVVDGIGVNELCNRLPRSEMATLFSTALDGGRKGSAFTDRELLGALPPTTLVQHIPLPHIYEAVIHARIANVHGYLPVAEPTKEAKEEPKPEAEAQPAEAAPEPAKTEPKSERPPKTNGSTRKSKRPPTTAETQANVEEDPEWIEIPESKR